MDLCCRSFYLPELIAGLCPFPGKDSLYLTLSGTVGQLSFLVESHLIGDPLMLQRLTIPTLALLAALALPPFAKADILEYSAGHADIGVAYEGGELELHYHFGINAIINGGALTADLEASPFEAYVRVPDSLYNADFASGASAFDFTGRTNSDPDLWLLPQSNPGNAPFLGIASEELNSSDWINSSTPITYQLDSWSFTPFGTGSVDRANFSLFQLNGITPDIKLATSDGIDNNDSFAPPFGHDHFNFGFTEQGLYGITLTASGTHVADGFKSSTGTFFFAVGDGTPGLSAVPEPSMMAAWSVASLAVGAGWLVRRRRSKQKSDSVSVAESSTMPMLLGCCA